MSGGGKSTLVSLVPGFYSATSGEILLDGRPIETISCPACASRSPW
jgi:subfamily B ATP-binding cassette protein MsbA